MTKAERKVQIMDNERIEYVKNLDYENYTPEDLIKKVASYISFNCWTVSMTEHAMNVMFTELFRHLSKVTKTNMYLQRFDRIVSSLLEKGNEVKGESIGYSLKGHCTQCSAFKKERTEWHSFGEINGLALDIDEKNGCIDLIMDFADKRGDFLLQKYKGKLTVTERFIGSFAQDPETGIWDEDEVELSVEPDEKILDTLLGIAELLASRKETAYKEQLIVEIAGRCYFYLYNADKDIVKHSAKNISDAKAKIDERLAGEGLYDADGNLNKTL